MRKSQLACVLVSALCALAAFADSEGNKFPGQGEQAKWQQVNLIFNEGVGFYRGGNYSAAIAKYKAAIDIYPFDHEYFNNLGLACKKAGQLEEARQALEHAISLKGDVWDSWSNLGSVLKRLGLPDKALQAYTKALSLHPPAKSRPLLEQNVAALRRTVSVSAPTDQPGRVVKSSQATDQESASPQSH